MKILILSLTIILVSSQVFGQKKSKVDPKDTQIATLTKQLDSVSKEMIKYVGVYDTLKKKVIHYNFDPAKTAYLIDSLKSLRGSSSMLLSTAYADTISRLRIENVELKTFVDYTKSEEGKNKAFMTKEEIDQAKIITILKEYKQLVDTKVLTEAEYIVLKKKYLDKL